MIEFFKKHNRKIVILLVAVIFLVGIILPLFVGDLPMASASDSKLGVMLIVSQILSAFFVVVGTVIAVWQYYLSSNSNIMKMKTDRVQKAIDLSKYYKDEILHPYARLKYVYVKAGITDMLAKEKGKMKEFDDTELHDIFPSAEFSKLEAKFKSNEYLKAIIDLDRRYDLGLTKCKELEENIDVSKISAEVRTSIINTFNNKYTTMVMNNMEHFAMYFTHKVADESVIYQSLAPTYLEMCRYYYYNISKCSKSGDIKLYRNLKDLYVIWDERTEKTKQDIRRREVDKGTIVE